MFKTYGTAANAQCQNVRSTFDPPQHIPNDRTARVQPYFPNKFPHLTHSQTFQNLRNASLAYSSTTGARDLDNPSLNLVMPWQVALHREISVHEMGVASSSAASQYSLARVLTLKAVLSKLLIPSLIKSFLLYVLCLLQCEDLLNRRLLVRLGDIIVLVQVLRGLAQPALV